MYMYAIHAEMSVSFVHRDLKGRTRPASYRHTLRKNTYSEYFRAMSYIYATVNTVEAEFEILNKYDNFFLRNKMSGPTRLIRYQQNGQLSSHRPKTKRVRCGGTEETEMSVEYNDDRLSLSRFISPAA